MSTHLNPERRNYVTASEAAALFGASPWKTVGDLYAEKVYGVADDSDTEAARYGRGLEAFVLTLAQEKLGPLTAFQEFIVRDPNSATLDARVADSLCPVDAKTAGIAGPIDYSLWGEPWTDQIPDYYLVQMHVQLLVTGADLAYLAALIGGKGFRIYKVERDDLVSEQIQTASETFLQYVRRQIPPPEVPQLETLKRMRRTPGKLVDIPDELWLQARLARQSRLDAEKREASAERSLLAAIGDAEGARCNLGEVWYLERKRSGYTVQPSSYRQLQWKEAK